MVYRLLGEKMQADTEADAGDFVSTIATANS
jgi:hypothetical protein